MKVLAHVHGYPPTHNCGAEWMLHHMMKELVKQGHECRVITQRLTTNELDGVKLYETALQNEIARHYDWAECVFSHLDWTNLVIRYCRGRRITHYHIIHNSTLYPTIKDELRFTKLIYNSEWIKVHHQENSKYKHDNLVFYPPVLFDDYNIEPSGENITLINLWPDKGGDVFTELGKSMPQYKFLGCKGGYGNQVILNSARKPNNIEYVENTPNIKEVYSRSKIVLMPSKYESWGRVATEAMCAGIPVIAHPTPGLKENLSYAGIFCDRDNLKEWQDAINKLMTDDEYYKEVSTLCKKRAMELDSISKNQLKQLEHFMLTSSFRKPTNNEIKENYISPMGKILVKVERCYQGNVMRRTGEIILMDESEALPRISRGLLSVIETPKAVEPEKVDNTEPEKKVLEPTIKMDKSLSTP